MRRALQIVIACLIVAGLIAFFFHGRVPRRESERWKTRVVASFPIGEGRDTVASYPGVDGHTYGPLAFAATGHQFCILDTYRSQVLIVGRGSRGRQPVHRITIAEGLLEAVAWDARIGAWLVADNRHLTVWAVQGGRARPLIRLGENKRLSGAIASLAVGPGGQIFVSWALIGHGQFRATLGQYESNGRPIREHTAVVGAAGLNAGTARENIVLLTLSGIAVGPGGNVYLLSGAGGQTGSPRQRDVLVVSPATLSVQGHIALPLRPGHLALLGITRTGTVYVTAGRGAKPRWVLGYDQEGKLVQQLSLPGGFLYSGVYADVTPSGSLYITESTANRYQIRAVTRR